MPLYQGFVQLGAGLSVGLAGLAAGFAIGIVGDAGVRGTAQQPRLFVGMVRHSYLCSGSLFMASCGEYGRTTRMPPNLAISLPTTIHFTYKIIPRATMLISPSIDPHPHFRRSFGSLRCASYACSLLDVQPLTIWVPGLIVALIMNTKAAGSDISVRVLRTTAYPLDSSPSTMQCT